MRKQKPPAFIDKYLGHSEEVLEVDRPVLLRMRHVQIHLILFGCFWLAINFFMMDKFSDFGGSRSFGRSSSFDSFGTIFMLVLYGFRLLGLGMIFHPLIKAFENSLKWYVVTNERALIIHNLIFTQWIRSYRPYDLNTIERYPHGDDTGDVIFAEQTYTYTSNRHNNGVHITWNQNQGPQVGFGSRRRTGIKRIGFFDSPDYMDLYDALMHLKEPDEEKAKHTDYA